MQATMRRTVRNLKNRYDIDDENFNLISNFQEDETIWCFCIARSCTKKKTKNGKPYYVVEVIDTQSVVKKIRCWGIDPELDSIQLNKPYLLRPKYNADWGFSTRGKLGHNWVLLS